MSKTFQLNKSGVRELLQSEEIGEVLAEQARVIRDRCGLGYEMDSYVGKNRRNAMVWAKSARAKRDNKKNNTILKAVR